jgi:hypothetical protein
MALSWTSEEREWSMSSEPIPQDGNPEIDDGTLSDVIRKPTRTAGDLSGVAEGSAEITTEDVARDLESVAMKARTQTEELLEELLERVGELAESVRRMERYNEEISQLTERVSRVERKIASSPVHGTSISSPPVEPAVPASPQEKIKTTWHGARASAVGRTSGQ